MIPRKLSSLLQSAFLLSLFPQVATAQQIGTGIPEVHPRFRTQRCTKSGGCKTQQTYLVSDARHRPFYNTEGEIVECSAANKVLCPDEATCAKNCILDGVEYGSLGVLASNTAVTLRNYLFDGKKYRSISPRVYLLAEDGENYEPIKLLNQEISFQVDVSNIGCGMNGALYLSELDFAGGRSKLNLAGAKYGTGYCDAQCPKSDFVNGVVSEKHPMFYPNNPFSSLSTLHFCTPGKPGFLRRLLQRNGRLGSQLARHDHDFASLQANGPFSLQR